jgi:hypothetical protein
MPRKSLQIRYRKLGREQARGQFLPALNVIELDERLEGEEHLEVLLHESLHALQPHHDEETVARDAVNLARILWVDGYRRLPEQEKPPRRPRKNAQKLPSGKTTPHKLSKTINKCGLNSSEVSPPTTKLL